MVREQRKSLAVNNWPVCRKTNLLNAKQQTGCSGCPDCISRVSFFEILLSKDSINVTFHVMIDIYFWALSVRISVHIIRHRTWHSPAKQLSRGKCSSLCIDNEQQTNWGLNQDHQPLQTILPTNTESDKSLTYTSTKPRDTKMKGLGSIASVKVEESICDLHVQWLHVTTSYLWLCNCFSFRMKDYSKETLTITYCMCVFF